ncbi:hypothetical protein DV701_07845 [Ornithinimicrobium avium]|uniref:Uncharacterized protein n=1 Tax=Ornithinimicrobium avium TaxID=2283195 RepID=A0A345NLZ3_9MICO|nr:hypothetical protein DV701_07845 [Ornithinimicrobium avium]
MRPWTSGTLLSQSWIAWLTSIASTCRGSLRHPETSEVNSAVVRATVTVPSPKTYGPYAAIAAAAVKAPSSMATTP